MRVDDRLSGDLQDALSKGVLKRIPLTFLPFVNEQLKQWENLFPKERQSVERLLLYVASLSPEQSKDLFRTVVDVEDKMGVRHWQFSTTEQTIQNSSQLAASPYFQEWRRAVQAVFDAADAHAVKKTAGQVQSERKLVLLGIPPDLPLDRAAVWRRWQGVGRPVRLDLGKPDPGKLSLAGSGQTAFELLVAGFPNSDGQRSKGLLDAALSRPGASSADAWVIDAGRSLVDTLVAQGEEATSPSRAILLSNGRLDQFRQSFSREMNTMRKDLADADAVFDRLRKVDVTRWCPPEVEADAATREFVRSLYLTGNGAVIFGNSFAQWASSEAIRRARPSFLAAQFGVRSKPKPFTGVAVFDNPDQINPLPAVDDLPGSAVDAQMLALYVWLAAYRYDEYQRSTVCICVAESLSEAYVVAPPEFSLMQGTEPVSLGRLSDALRSWMA
ncbi:MAG: hypothetical protein ABSF53_08350 [Terracidiphilus sp.]